MDAEATLLWMTDEEEYEQSPVRIDVSHCDTNSVSVDIQDVSGTERNQLGGLYLDSFRAFELGKELIRIAKESAPDYSELAS